MQKKEFTSWGVTLLLAFILGVAILSATHILTGKWLAAAVATLFISCILIIFRNVELPLLFIFVFSLPINLDFYFFPSEKYTAGAGGISISVCDLALTGLYLIWTFRLTSLPSEKRRLHLFPSLSIPFWLLWFWGLLSSLSAPKPQLSFYELIEMAKAWLGFLYLANNIDSEGKIVLIIAGLVFAVLGQSLIGFAQHFTGANFGLEILGERTRLLLQKTGAKKLSRVGGTMGHPNGLAFFFIFSLTILLNFLLVKGRWWLKVFALPALMMGIMVLILTFSRGGWISFLIAAVLTVFLGIWRNRGFFNAIAASAVFWLFLLLLAVPFFPGISARLFEYDYGRASSRVPLMQVALNVIRAHPVMGVGLNNYALVMRDYDNTKEAISSYYPLPVHNVYLLTAAEMGLPALFLFLWFLAAAVRMGWRGFWRNEGLMSFFCLGLGGAFAGVLIQKIVECWSLWTYFLSLMIGAFGASQLWNERQDTDR